jgi:hypothetical protein
MLALMASAIRCGLPASSGMSMRKMIWERYGRWIPDADGGRELAKVEAFYTPKSPARRKPGAAN